MQRFGLMFAMIAAFLLPYLSVFRFVNFTPVNLFLSSIGVIICVIGIIFFVWVRQKLGKNWSGNVSIQEGQEQVTSGSYRYVRHPMYA